MGLEEGPLMTETLQEQPTPASQPAPAAANQPAPLPELDDAAVREAIARAEESGQNPESLTVTDLSQGKPPTAEAPASAEAPKPSVPEKFLKPDGAVDVEKLQASTRQLDEAIQKKEVNLDAAVEQMLKDYREKEQKFRGMPNPSKLPANSPPQGQEIPIGQDADYERVRQNLLADLNRDPLAFINTWVDIKVQEKLKPIEEEKRDNGIRGNLKAIAQTDPRVVSYINEINSEFDSDPGLLSSKNPHQVAWLQVKERLRLGEFQKGAPAQPSRTVSPVLGGGTPPPAPSSSAAQGIRAVDQLNSLNLKDKNQEAMGDEYIRALLAREKR